MRGAYPSFEQEAAARLAFRVEALRDWLLRNGLIEAYEGQEGMVASRPHARIRFAEALVGRRRPWARGTPILRSGRGIPGMWPWRWRLTSTGSRRAGTGTGGWSTGNSTTPGTLPRPCCTVPDAWTAPPIRGRYSRR
ncbi:hypothetical protein GXW82_43415 [Streptacidiphilus sp. 4-A2]|nr:hypothetical protein [Streptacidiphilus sp. 4-A2]